MLTPGPEGLVGFGLIATKGRQASANLAHHGMVDPPESSGRLDRNAAAQRKKHRSIERRPPLACSKARPSKIPVLETASVLLIDACDEVFVRDPSLYPIRTEPDYSAVMETAHQPQEAFLQRLH